MRGHADQNREMKKWRNDKVCSIDSSCTALVQNTADYLLMGGVCRPSLRPSPHMKHVWVLFKPDHSDQWERHPGAADGTASLKYTLKHLMLMLMPTYSCTQKPVLIDQQKSIRPVFLFGIFKLQTGTTRPHQVARSHCFWLLFLYFCLDEMRLQFQRCRRMFGKSQASYIALVIRKKVNNHSPRNAEANPERER